MPTSAAKRKGGGSKSTPSGSGNDRSYSDVVNTPGTSTPMRRAPSYSDIDLIIKFEPHLVYGDKWAAGWNTAYDIILNVGSVSGLLTESGAIVANPSACLLPAIADEIIDQCISADDNTLVNFASLFLSKALLRIHRGSTKTRLIKSTFGRSLDSCVREDHELLVFVSMNDIYADFRVRPFTFKDLTLYGDKPFVDALDLPCPSINANYGTAAATATSTSSDDLDRVTAALERVSASAAASSLPSSFGTDLGAAIASALPPPTSSSTPIVSSSFADDLRAAITAGVTAAVGTTVSSLGTGASSSSATTSMTAPSTTVFNPASLPTGATSTPPTMEPRDRYFANQQHRVLTKTVLHTTYANGQRYHIDGRRLVLADGTVFVRQDIEEKAIFRALVQCRDTDASSVRSWYHNMGKHLRDHGCFVLPFWLFRKDGGDRGFSIGDAAGAHDLPSLMQLHCDQASHIIFRYLSQDKVFPSESRCRRIVDSCRGDGYRALKQIVFSYHPAFQSLPGAMVSSPPTQGDDDVLVYVNRFLDYLQLRAYIQNIESSIADPDIQDILFTNAKYSDYLVRMSRRELLDPTLAYKFCETHIVETIQGYLNEPDSPLFADWQKQRLKEIRSLHQSPRASPTFKPINPVDTAPSTDDSELDPDAELNALYEDAAALEPSTDEEKQLHQLYKVSILAVHKAAPRNCLICNEPHTFDACPVLNNTQFLRNHFIRFCQFLKRDQSYIRNGEVWKGGSRPSSRNSQSSRSSPPGRSSPRARQPSRPTPVHIMDAMDATQEPSDHDLAALLSDAEPDDIPGISYQDFLQGRLN